MTFYYVNGAINEVVLSSNMNPTQNNETKYENNETKYDVSLKSLIKNNKLSQILLIVIKLL